jgi:hypothetical protein
LLILYLIDSTNPMVAGIDGAVRSFVEYLYALAGATWIRKLQIPNAIRRDQAGHLYGVPMVAILDWFSNIAAVQIRMLPALEGSLPR